LIAERDVSDADAGRGLKVGAHVPATRPRVVAVRAGRIAGWRVEIPPVAHGLARHWRIVVPRRPTLAPQVAGHIGHRAALLPAHGRGERESLPAERAREFHHELRGVIAGDG